jgi:hypothetical protein
MLLGLLVRRTLTQEYARARARQQVPLRTIRSIRPNRLRHLDSNHEFATVRWPNANIFGACPREHILGGTDHQLSDEAGILASGQPARVMGKGPSVVGGRDGLDTAAPATRR